MPIVPVWGPVLALLSEINSSDGVLQALRLVGFGGFDLSDTESYSHNTRKRAYLRIAERAFSQLSESEQWARATALARTLAEDNDRKARLSKALEGVGWQFDGAHFSKLGEPAHARPAFFQAGDAHDAYVHIRSILQTAKLELLIIDPYAGEKIYSLISTVPNLERYRILCGKPKGDFIQEAEEFAKQYKTPLEIRVAPDFHDRFVIADQKVFMFGSSIEHAANKAFAVFPIEGEDLAGFIRGYAERVWAAAKVLFPPPALMN
jgi:hypothetical protein